MVFSFTKLISALLAFLTLFASTYEVNIEKDLSETIEIIETTETTETEPNEDVNLTGDDDIVIRIATHIPEDQLADVFAKAVADFSDTLYSKTAENNTDKSNLVLSPLSAYYALSLIANGASGDTLNEIETALGNIPVEQLNEYLSALTDRLTSNDGSKVVVGNSTWTNSERFILSEKFIDTAVKYYDAEAVSLPFNNSALGKINGWVKEKTDGMIPSILNELDSKATMVLINTILFDGKWEKEYTELQISDGVFYNYDGTASEAEFLFSKENGSYFTVDRALDLQRSIKEDSDSQQFYPAETLTISWIILILILSLMHRLIRGAM
jgi:serpin B